MNSYIIDGILPQIRRAVRENPAVVLQAPPASGKTTRVPPALLDVLASPQGKIVMLEPRRIAAVAAARWMARILGEEVGQTVGYSIRFDSRISKKTRIEVVTEGILTRRILADPALEGTAMVIFDEFHERSLQTDLALALCLDIRNGLREDLKLLVMSATLDGGPLASLLGGAPVLSAEGATFPVTEHYRPDNPDRPLEERIAGAVRAALRETTGDLLVFLPGAGEIRRTAAALESVLDVRGEALSIHPLYGDLPFAEQERAILPAAERKIVLATNIAETSLTIEGVGAVIDSGLSRRLQYDPATGMNRLMTVAVSRAAAEQRRGRAGRLGPGVCYRLYSRHVFASLAPYGPPEILIADLASLVLDLAVWGVRDPGSLAWLDSPPAAAWASASELLRELGALDTGGAATTVGQTVARLPLHPRLGRLLVRAAEQGHLRLGADLAALLAERDILRHKSSAAGSRKRGSDIGERHDVLQQWRREKKPPEGADPWVLRAVDRVSQQLRQLLGNAPPAVRGEIADTLPRLLLAAYPDRIAKRRAEGSDRYLLRQGRGVRLPAARGTLDGAYLIAAHVDAGEKAEGTVHLAEPLTEDTLRQEMAGEIAMRRRIEWDKREDRVISVREERLGAILLSERPLNPTDMEAIPLLCEAIRSDPALLTFREADRQLQGRVALMKRAYPAEGWPDLSEERLRAAPADWLSPFLGGVRTGAQLAGLVLLPALTAQLSWEQRRRLDERAPVTLAVPSGHRAPLDYTAGDIPILAVKLQEMFGLADTPCIAEGRVPILLHLLSPARRPVQITQDLKGFWNSGYLQVKKELKGRYPKHPWPDDPWNAVPTRRTTARKG